MTDNTPSYPILLHYAILIRSRDQISLRSMVNSYSNQDQSSALKVLFRINYFTFGRFYNLMTRWRNYIYSYCSSLMMEVSVSTKVNIKSITYKDLFVKDEQYFSLNFFIVLIQVFILFDDIFIYSQFFYLLLTS